MRIWYYSLLLSFSSLAQVEHVKVIKSNVEKSPYFAHIGSYYEGEIPYPLLCNSEGISSSQGFRVVSFTIQFGYASEEHVENISGHVIPSNLCYEIANHFINGMVFITNLVAMDENGQTINMYPLNLIPVTDEP
jgi:hypothetical protein